jgi:hypothetical protein
VNHLIEGMYEGIHREKSWVRFGISPFGLGRPDRRPPGINGFSQYDKLYADAETWLQNGWLDYFTPQLYWSIRAGGPGLRGAAGLLDGAEHQGPPHLAGPVHQPHRRTRTHQGISAAGNHRPDRRHAHAPGAGGHVHFSMAALMQNRKGIADQLRAVSYTGPALVPATPWLGKHDARHARRGGRAQGRRGRT